GDPDADAPRPPFSAQIELRQGADEPFLEAVDEGPDVAAAALEVEHDIADALPRPVIGVLPAAAALKHREAAGLDEIAVARARAGGIERRMLEEPHELRRGARADGGNARLHRRDRRLVGLGRIGDLPFDRAAHALHGFDPACHIACYASADLVISRTIARA